MKSGVNVYPLKFLGNLEQLMNEYSLTDISKKLMVD